MEAKKPDNSDEPDTPEQDIEDVIDEEAGRRFGRLAETFVWLNSAGLLAVSFSAGLLWSRVAYTEQKTADIDIRLGKVAVIEAMSQHIADLSDEVKRLRDRLDLVLDARNGYTRHTP